MREEERLWNYIETAEYLNKPPGVIRVMCSKRQIPSLKIGRSVRFRKSDIDLWLEKQKVEIGV